MNAYELAKKLDEYNADGFPVLIVEQASNMLRQQAGELEYYKVRDSSHLKIIKEQADQIAELEKDLYMIQRHYDQLETFSPSGNNSQDMNNADKNLPKGNV